jgi:hypothetical protein
MKKIIPILVLLLILIGVFSWKIMSEKEVVEQTPVEVLDNATKADTTDEIEVKLDTIDINASSTVDFETMDADIKSI